MKKLILISTFLLITSTSHAKDKWTGPTSTLDPMWGLTGSSLMAENLRPKPLPNPLLDDNEDKIKEAYKRGKKDGSNGSNNYGIYIPGDD